MSRQNLAKQFTRVLRHNEIEYRVVETDGDSPAVTFRLDNGTASEIGVTAILGNELAILVIPAGIEIPEARWDDVVAWVLDINSTHAPASFILNREERTLAIRHAVDCRGIPSDLLDTTLPLAWSLIAGIWRDFAPEILRLIAGQVDELDQATADIMTAMKAAVVERFDRDVADALDAPLYNMAAEYLQRIELFEIEDTDGVAIHIKGSDDAAVLSIAVDGLDPFRFRFSPRRVRERFLADNQGLTLYFNALPDQAPRLLASDWVDERISIRDYEADHDGIPVLEDDERFATAVPLTSAPLGPDDRGARTAVIRIEWDGDAPSLRDCEQIHTVQDEAEMSMVEDTVRRWHVPAAVLNHAVRTKVASVALAG